MGVHAPAVMIVSFIPMLLIAAAYNYMNKADPDCGTSFTWVTRAMGPHLGWLTGWAIVAADVVVMATLAYIAGVYTFLLFGLDAAATNLLDVSIVAGDLDRADDLDLLDGGIELSARTQFFLLAMEIFALALFAVVALVKVYAGSAPAGLASTSRSSWFSPFSLPGGSTALIDGVLLGVFIYWGWDSGVCVNEESENSANGPGKAAVMSTVLLVLIYVVVAVAAQAYGGTEFLRHNQDDVLSALGGSVFGSPLDKLLIIAVLTSASASTQTTILPTARTTLSMARFGAIPKAFGRDSSQVPDPGRVDADDGRRVADLDADHHQRQPERARRLDHRARFPDRLLLRADRVRLRDLLPQGAVQELPQLLHGGRRPVRRRSHAHLHLREGVHRQQAAWTRPTRAACSGSGPRSRSGSDCCSSAWCCW